MIKKRPIFSLALLFAIACTWVFTNHALYRKKALIVYDMAEYYLYLPAFFLHQDLQLNYIFTPEGEGGFYWFKPGPGGSRVIKMTCGVAMLESPFFGIAHLSAHLFGWKPDGWSPVYQFFIGISGIFYASLGIYLLGCFLLAYFPLKPVLLTIASLGFATNYFYYSAHENGMSHVYSFCLISALLFTVRKTMLSRTSILPFLFAGLISGLVVAVRPVNMLLLPFVFLLVFAAEKKSPLIHFKENIFHYLLVCMAGISILLPQFFYYKLVTGQWYFYAYVDEKFFFQHPQLINVLIGYRKGLLVYCPVLFLLIPGFFMLFSHNKWLGIITLIGAAAYIYVVSSWWCWWYGGSFGMRALIDVFPLFSLPFVLVCHWAINAGAVWRNAIYVFTSCCALLLWIQFYQYTHCIIHYDGMNRKAYWHVFLSRKVAPAEYIHSPDYEKAVKGQDID
ncbi:MAG: hypothetical protein ACK5CO_07705 [Bacteroidota bacterium]